MKTRIQDVYQGSVPVEGTGSQEAEPGRGQNQTAMRPGKAPANKVGGWEGLEQEGGLDSVKGSKTREGHDLGQGGSLWLRGP
jgi:hypothetical protein